MKTLTIQIPDSVDEAMQGSEEQICLSCLLETSLKYDYYVDLLDYNK